MNAPIDIRNLPQDIVSNKETLSDSILIQEYAASESAFKNKSILHRNVCSLVISGQKTMHFSEKTVVVDSKTFHILSSGNCIASMFLSPREIFRSILLFFDDTVLTEFTVKFRHRINSIRRKKQPTPLAYIAFQKDAFMENYIASLDILLKSTTPLSAEMKLLKFEELMLYLVEQHPDSVLAFQAKPNHTLEDTELRIAVEANITNNLKVEELAFLCNMSVSTFKRRFAQLYGTSPHKWLLRRKMEMAAQLLQQQHEKPSDVFYKVGYQNHSSFTQSFKDVFGITPKEYQAQQLND